METINDRLSQVVNQMFGGNKAACERAVGMKLNALSNYVGPGKHSVPGTDILEKILSSIDVDALWLITGKGEMERKPPMTDVESAELLKLCKELVASYQQFGEQMSRLEALVKRMEG